MSTDASAACDILPLIGEMNDGFVPLPHPSLSQNSRDEITPWIGGTAEVPPLGSESLPAVSRSRA